MLTAFYSLALDRPTFFSESFCPREHVLECKLLPVYIKAALLH